jgi:hypothetical protein
MPTTLATFTGFVSAVLIDDGSAADITGSPATTDNNAISSTPAVPRSNRLS